MCPTEGPKRGPSRDPRRDGAEGPGPKGAEAFEAIHLGLGRLLGSLGDAFGDLLAEAARKGGAERREEAGDGPVRATSHVRIRMGGLDLSSRDLDRAARGTGPRPRARAEAGPRTATRPDPAAAAQPAAPPAAPEAPRDPVFEVWEEEAAFVLEAELPGVADDELVVSLGEGRLVLATTGARRYRVETPVPAWLTEEALTHRLRNGILELRAAKPAPDETGAGEGGA